MGTELEWKYAVPEPALLDEILCWQPIRCRMTHLPREYHMQSEYYDTPDRRLSKQQITLRRRLENGAAVVCVKAPLSGSADPCMRGEWELSGSDLALALPQLVASGAPAVLLEAPCLECVCQAAFNRRAVLLRFADGSTAELALDQGCLAGPTQSIPLCELELEAKTGDPAAACAFVKTLAARFLLQPEPRSKFARASLLP